MKTSELTRLLQKHGCYRIDHGGSHDLWYSPVTRRKLVVPRHGGQEIPTGTANRILKDAGLK